MLELSIVARKCKLHSFSYFKFFLKLSEISDLNPLVANLCLFFFCQREVVHVSKELKRMFPDSVTLIQYSLLTHPNHHPDL